MEEKRVHCAAAGEIGSPEALAEWLNGQGLCDWRIHEYSPEESRLIIKGSAGERELMIMCLGTLYVKSQVFISSPSFNMEAGGKKMAEGILSSRCYDSSIRLVMKDGVNAHEIICDYVAAGETADRRIAFPDRNP